MSDDYEYDDDDGIEDVEPSISEADQATLDAVKASGLSAEELVAAKRRAEAAALNAGQETETPNPNEVVTREDAEKISLAAAQKVSEERDRLERNRQIQNKVLGDIDGIIDADGYFNDSQDFRDQIMAAVSAKLNTVNGISSMNQGDFDKVVAEKALEAIEEKKQAVAKLTGNQVATETATRRINAQKDHGQTARAGRSPHARTLAVEGHGPVIGLGLKQPTQLELAAEKEDLLDDFWKGG